MPRLFFLLLAAILGSALQVPAAAQQQSAADGRAANVFVPDEQQYSALRKRHGNAAMGLE